MEQAADNGAGKDATTNHQWEQSGKGKQWLATTRVRGHWLAMVAKGGRRLEEGLLWKKRSDHGIRGGRGILDLNNKDACG
jgi:hypothetical protein